MRSKLAHVNGSLRRKHLINVGYWCCDYYQKGVQFLLEGFIIYVHVKVNDLYLPVL